MAGAGPSRLACHVYASRAAILQIARRELELDLLKAVPISYFHSEHIN